MPSMNRREFLATGAACAAAAGTVGLGATSATPASASQRSAAAIRAMFPRLRGEVFLNAAGGTPLGQFAEAGVARYLDYWRMGPGGGRGDDFAAMLAGVRARFASLIGARPTEIALVPSTKAGEQVVLDSLPALRAGGNVVTNDLHFAGCLHNLEGLRRRGLDVRIVRHTNWSIDTDRMAAAMDDRTALVSVTLVSNVNGHVEPIRELADLAHRRGAIVYADVIQAAGILPIDVRAMGIDAAACNGYKWLFGPHGAGFLFVAEEHQGRTFADRLVPGHARHNYPPWVDSPQPGEPLLLTPLADARRYEPGHHAYLAYAGVHEALGFLQAVGVAAAQVHSTTLARRLVSRLDPGRYPCISPHRDRSPIVTFTVRNAATLEPRLREAGVTVALSTGQVRVSPAIYNTEADVGRLADVLNSAT